MTAPEWSGPKTIGTYRVVGLVGVGASASVFRAVRPEDDFQVAIKVLADNHSAVADTRRRFAEEQRLMARLEHPTIATVYDTGQTDDGRPYTVMELANRGDLRNRVNRLSQRGRTATAGDIRMLALHLREALTVLHDQEIVHRDISPANILIRADVTLDRPPMTLQQALLEPGERLLLADLGFAKRLADASGLTRGGGTKGFAAPEQRTAVSIVDHRADLYSATALVKWLAENSPLEDCLADFVARGTAESPDERHENIEQWYNDLGAALDANDLGAALATASYSARRPEPRLGSGDRPSKIRATLGRLPAPFSILGVVILAAAAVLSLPLLRGTGLESGSRNLVALVIGQNRLQSETVENSASADSDTVEPVISVSGPPTTVGATNAAEPTTSRGTALTTISVAESNSPPTTGTSPTTSSANASTSASASALSSPTTVSPTVSTAVPSTAVPSTAVPSTASTTVPTTGGPTTTVNPFPSSPRGYFEAPMEGADVTGGTLTVAGTAVSPQGISWVELTIRHSETGEYWHDQTTDMRAEFVRFQVPVTPAGGDEASWTYRLSTADLPAGSYRLRVWARSTSGVGDPLSDIRNITVG